jgi:hypothetical protein
MKVEVRYHEIPPKKLPEPMSNNILLMMEDDYFKLFVFTIGVISFSMRFRANSITIKRQK